MTKMPELFEKVTKDADLQEKMLSIIKDAEKTSEESIKDRLAAFAKDAGYEITPEEMQAFFEGLTEKSESELSDAELDMVAGGSPITDSISSFLRKLINLNCFRSDGIITS